MIRIRTYECTWCKYLDVEKNVFPPCCPAFPKGIPADIRYGESPHIQKVKGQVGDYVFEKDDAFIKK